MPSGNATYVSFEARTPRKSATGPREEVDVRFRLLGLVALALMLSSSCDSEDLVAPDPSSDDPGVLVSGYGVTDAIAVLGDDDFLFAERSGSLHHYVRGDVAEVRGLPATRMSDVYGGLLDVSLHPDFQENRQVYIAYNDANYDLIVARFELRDDQVHAFRIIHEWREFSIGSRIEWEDPSHFFVSFGVGGFPFPDAGPQDLQSDRGKIHRLTADGAIPADNPILPGAAGPTSIWSYGHRNPQGLHYDARRERLYAVEHGPMGGDELNIVTKGGNYGWPLFSYGLNYDGSVVSDLSEEEAGDQSILPMKAWGPDFRVAPSGLLLLEDGPQSAWTGSFLLGALNLQHLLRYDPATDETEIVLSGVGRVRDVAQLPNGTLLFSVDAGSPTPAHRGRIIQLPPGPTFP